MLVKLNHFPKDSGWKYKNYLSCHHPVINSLIYPLYHSPWKSTPGKGDSYWKPPFLGYVSFREGNHLLGGMILLSPFPFCCFFRCPRPNRTDSAPDFFFSESTSGHIWTSCELRRCLYPIETNKNIFRLYFILVFGENDVNVKSKWSSYRFNVIYVFVQGHFQQNVCYFLQLSEAFHPCCMGRISSQTRV